MMFMKLSECHWFHVYCSTSKRKISDLVCMTRVLAVLVSVIHYWFSLLPRIYLGIIYHLPLSRRLSAYFRLNSRECSMCRKHLYSIFNDTSQTTFILFQIQATPFNIFHYLCNKFISHSNAVNQIMLEAFWLSCCISEEMMRSPFCV